MRPLLLILAFLLAACSQSAAAISEPVRSFPVPEISNEKPRAWIETGFPAQAAPRLETSVEAAPQLETSVEAEADPYANWPQRCEPLDKARLCETSKDCRDVYHPSGKPLKCVTRWRSEVRVCSPGWSDRTERKWRRERLRTLVHSQYFATTQEGWKGGQARQRANKLSDFLWLVYKRETTARPWKRHRLDGDVKVARTDWFRQAERYGWSAKQLKKGVVQMMPCTDCKTAPSPHYQNANRWAFGLGPYGQIASLWVATWDTQAPPEILCGEVESTETYLRGARRVWRKLRGGIQCNGNLYQPDVTWEVLHRGVAGGKLCPGKQSEKFRRRADRLGLDPDQKVTLSMLGEPINREQQNEVAIQLYALMDAALPTPEALGS